MKKIRNWLKGEITKLVELPDRPHSVAMGTACGIGIGFTPLYGVKTLLALGAAFLFRGNRLAAVLVVNLHDILLPFMPIVFYGQYKLGNLMMGRFHHQSEMVKVTWANWHEIFSWTIFFNDGLPLLLGSLVFGLVSAPIAYFVTLRVLQKAQARRAARKRAQEHHAEG